MARALLCCAGMGCASEGGDDGELLARLARQREALEKERSGALELLAELLALPEETQAERMAQDARFHGWGVAERLAERAETLLGANPAEAFRLARLALAAADALPEHHPPPLVQDFLARAWASVGQACLRTGDAAGAGFSLAAAAACLAEGTGDLLVDARLLEFEAAVRSSQGRTGEALALLKQAAARYRQANQDDLLARVLARRDELLLAANEPLTLSHLAFDPVV